MRLMDRLLHRSEAATYPTTDRRIVDRDTEHELREAEARNRFLQAQLDLTRRDHAARRSEH